MSFFAAERLDIMLELQYIIPDLDWRTLQKLNPHEIESWVIQASRPGG